MLTARSILITAIAVAILAILGSLLSLLQPPDQGGLAMDTYGTRAQGYRAVFDTLKELNFDVRRELGPPDESVDRHVTLVFWAPQTDLIEIEPVYLQRLRQWIRNGGRLIIAPQAKRDAHNDALQSGRRLEFVKSTSVLQEIGLPGIETTLVDLPSNSSLDETDHSAQRPSNGSLRTQEHDTDGFKADIDRYLFPTLFPTQTTKVRSEGKFADLAAEVSSLELPSSVQVLDFGLTKPDGTINIPLQSHDSSVKQESNTGSASAVDQKFKASLDWITGQQAEPQSQKPAVLAAIFKLGAGDVIVVSDPAIFDNRLFTQADNAVLAVGLLGHPQQAIIWDEFYHGLTIRGNPLFLLTRSFYGLVVAMIVALTAIWVWRQSLFLGPPLADLAVKRRTVAEYVEAMASFFHRGSESLMFMLQELRRGVLWSLRRKYGGHGEREGVDEVAQAVARHDPEKARKLLDAVKQADLMLSTTSRAKQRDILHAAKDLFDCL